MTPPEPGPPGDTSGPSAREGPKRQVRGIRGIRGISRAWVLWVAGFLLVTEFTHVILGSTQAYARGYLHPLTLAQIVAQSLLLIAAYAFGAAHVDSWLGNLSLGVAMYFSGEWILEMDRPTTFTLAATYWGGVVVVGVVALAFALGRFLWFLGRASRRFRDSRRSRAPPGKASSPAGTSSPGKASPPPGHATTPGRRHPGRPAWTRDRVGLVLLALVVATGVTHAVLSSSWAARPVTITPRDYPIEFRFWASHDPTWYLAHPHGAEMLAQFDRHHAVIQNAWIPLRDAAGNLESFAPTVYAPDVARLVSNLTWFHDHYPNIRFQYYAAGVGHGSCGNYEGSIYTPILVRRLVDVCRAHDLPNVVGVYTDWEGPGDAAPRLSNETRHGWHQALWTDAFAYVRTYFPEWTMSCCYPEGVAYDGADGDADLQYYSRYNIFTPPWDDYGPMIYRSCDSAVEPYDPGDDEGSWYVYAQAQALLEGALDGDASKATMWLGCTGCGPYRNASRVTERGQPLAFGTGGGFDALARDVLVLKHFGFPAVSIFHAIERFDRSSPALTGFFYQYGFADALDRLAEVVNGPNSTRSFTIWSNGQWSPRDDLALDFQLNFERPPFLLLGVAAGAAGILFVTLDRHEHPRSPRKMKK